MLFATPGGKSRTSCYPTCQLPFSLLISFCGCSEVSVAMSCPAHAHRVLPGSHSPRWSSHKPSPAALRAVCWCFCAVPPEDPAQLKRDTRYLLCSSLPLPAPPFMSAMSTSLQKLGKASDVCRLVGCLFVKCPCVSCQMDRKGLLLSPRSAAPCCPRVSHLPGTHCCSLSLQVHCIYLNPSQLSFLQPLETWRARLILGLPV